MDTFYDQLRRSKLLPTEALDELTSEAGPAATSVVLAGICTRKGWLTPWQARQLLNGQANFVLGRYRLTSELGRGGMGTVYQGIDTGDNNRTVAIKVMDHSMLDDPELLARFQREVKAGSALKHPNLVRIYQSDQIGATHFFVMELVAGQDLSSWLRAKGPLPVGWSCECVRQACIGLQYAHELGLIHRDIKPENLLVVADSVTDKPLVKVLDLGLARFTTDDDIRLTATGQIVGTVDYMSQEQAASSKHADVRSDVFSLGCTLFKLLTNRLPYSGRNVAQKIASRQKDDPRRITEFRGDVPPDLEKLILRTLSRNPNERPQSARELATLLDRFCEIDPEGRVDLSDTPAPSSWETASTDIPITAAASPADTVVTAPPSAVNGRRLWLLGGLLGVAGLGLIAAMAWGPPAELPRLSIRVDQPAVEVRIDDGQVVLMSQAAHKPVDIELVAGSHRLQVLKQGFQIYTAQVHLSPGQKSQLDVKLTPIEDLK